MVIGSCQHSSQAIESRFAFYKMDVRFMGHNSITVKKINFCHFAQDQLFARYYEQLFRVTDKWHQASVVIEKLTLNMTQFIAYHYYLIGCNFCVRELCIAGDRIQEADKILQFLLRKRNELSLFDL